MTFPFLVNKVRSFSAASTAFSQSFGSNSGDATGQSRRIIVTPMSAGGSQIRARFLSDSTLSFVCAHASVGYRSGSTAGTTATPVEFKFSSASGFSISSNTSITSDWLDFPTTTSDTLLITFDITSGGFRFTNAGSLTGYSQTGAFYNNSSASGWTGNANSSYGVDLVEVRYLV